MSDTIVLLGVGNVALHVAKLLSNRCTIFGTTRSADRVSLLEANGIRPILVDGDSLPKHLLTDANVLVSFPPDGTTDSTWSAQCNGAKRIVYISSTGVYGKTKGVINEESPVDVDDPRRRGALLPKTFGASAVPLSCAVPVCMLQKPACTCA